MKQHLLLLLIAAPFFNYAQQTYTWIAPSGSWSDASNWSPQRVTPAPDDVLAFNTTATVTGLPASEAVGKISIYNNAVVSFSASGTSTISIGHASVPAPHLAVAAGSAVSITGANPLSFHIGAGYSALVNGNLSFSGAAHRLTAVAPNTIVFSAGAVFTAAAGFSGNAFGNVAANKNSVVFQSGATYIFKDGGTPFGLAAPDAVTIFNNGSIYRHQVNGVGPSMRGRTYGNVYIEANVNFAGIGSARDCIIQNDLNILSGFFSFKPNSLGLHTGNFNIYGNILASGTSYIDIGSNYMPGAVQLLGTNQVIGGGGGSGTISLGHFTVNNTSTSLLRPLTVQNTLNLRLGRIITSASAKLILAAGSAVQSCAHDYTNLSYTNMGCDLSYVEGPVQKLGLTGGDFIFPIGINGKLRPAAIRDATGDFTVEYIRADPYFDISNAMGSGIHHTSHLEYWNIAGAGTARVELSYFDPNSGGVTDMDALRVARFDGIVWADQGVTGYLGSPGANGSVTSSPVSFFGNFALAGASGYPNNPLPAFSIIFNARIEGGKVLLSWEADNEGMYKFYVVERAAANGIFNPISPETAFQNIDNHTYKFPDNHPGEGRNQYRLKLVKRDGGTVYSYVKTIDFAVKPGIFIYPNPAREKIFIKIPKSSSISRIAIVHISGSVIKWLTASNQTTATVDIHDLASGAYYIKIIQAGSSTCVPFVKY